MDERKKITLRLPPEIYEDFRQIVFDDRTNMQTFLLSLLEKELKRKKKNGKN